jgi:hypothetical protein
MGHGFLYLGRFTSPGLRFSAAQAVMLLLLHCAPGLYDFNRGPLGIVAGLFKAFLRRKLEAEVADWRALQALLLRNDL